MFSFGYGGTNSHVIVASIEALHQWYQHARDKKGTVYDRFSKKTFLLCFLAHDKTTLSRNVKAIGDLAADYYLADLAQTLNHHRTIFSHRAVTAAYESREAQGFASNALQIRDYFDKGNEHWLFVHRPRSKFISARRTTWPAV